MNTFLPYPDFEKSAKVLDNKRLWKQVLEAKQILNTLQKIKEAKINKNRHGVEIVTKIAWKNHPIVKMWKPHPGALRNYMFFMVKEWVKRRTGLNIRWDTGNFLDYPVYGIPKWLGDKELHRSHRAKLYEKDPEHYVLFKGDYDHLLKRDGKIEYVWR